MKRLIVTATILLACSTESTTTPPPDAGRGGAGGTAGASSSASSSSSSGGMGGAGGEEPLPDPDDGGCKLPNGGITCVTTADCPAADACTCYQCELVQTFRKCVAYSADAGKCGQ